MSGTRTGWRPWPLLALVLAMILIAAACGSSDGDDATEAAETDAGSTEESADAADGAGGDGGFSAEDSGEEADFGDDEAADDGEAMEEEAADEPSAESPEGDTDDPLGSGGANVTPTAADLGRQLIFTAFLSVGVDEVAAASAEATSIIEGLGGFLFGQSTEGGPEARSELIFKVLPDDFNRALERLGSVGELRNQTVSTDDVTERVVDLESRIEVAELGVDRLRAALEGTQTLEDYAEVERLLLDREGELEVMRGQLRTLRDRIDLATITLVLTQERIENRILVDATAYLDHDDGRSCAGRSEISAEEGSAVTICFEVTNAGDQTLTDIVLTDSVLDLDTADGDELIPVFGDLTELAPGQSVLLAYETEVERTIRLRTRVVATPTDGTSAEPAGPSVNSETSAEVRTFPSEDAPGFGEGFGAAVEVLRGLWIAATVIVGFLIPLLVLVPFLWLIWLGVRALRRRRPSRPSGAQPWAGGGSPPPPPPGSGPTAPEPEPVGAGDDG